MSYVYHDFKVEQLIEVLPTGIGLYKRESGYIVFIKKDIHTREYKTIKEAIISALNYIDLFEDDFDGLKKLERFVCKQPGHHHEYNLRTLKRKLKHAVESEDYEAAIEIKKSIDNWR